jgi:hypothetical protein
LWGEKHSEIKRDYPINEALTQKAQLYLGEDGIFFSAKAIYPDTPPSTHPQAGVKDS